MGYMHVAQKDWALNCCQKQGELSITGTPAKNIPHYYINI